MSKDHLARQKPTPNKLTIKAIKRLMSDEEMEAFAAACRIRYGTAQPEDYVTVARYERSISETDDHASGSD